MKALLTNKSINGLTGQYISIVRKTAGNGLRKEYIFKLLEHITTDATIADIEKVIIELKKVDKQMNNRYNRNIIAMLGRILKLDLPKAKKEAKELVNKGFKVVGYSEMTDSFKGTIKPITATEEAVKPTEEAVKPTEEPVKVTKCHGVTNGTKEEIINVTEETKNVRDEIINNAQTITKMSTDDMIDTYLSTVNAFDEMVANFDPKSNPNKTAMLISLMQKALQL